MLIIVWHIHIQLPYHLFLCTTLLRISAHIYSLVHNQPLRAAPGNRFFDSALRLLALRQFVFLLRTKRSYAVSDSNIYTQNCLNSRYTGYQDIARAYTQHCLNSRYTGSQNIARATRDAESRYTALSANLQPGM